MLVVWDDRVDLSCTLCQTASVRAISPNGNFQRSRRCQCGHGASESDRNAVLASNDLDRALGKFVSFFPRSKQSKSGPVGFSMAHGQGEWAISTLRRVMYASIQCDIPLMQ